MNSFQTNPLQSRQIQTDPERYFERYFDRKEAKDKKEKIKMKIKQVNLQDLMTEAKMVKEEIKEIKEENSTDINERNIAELINLKEFSNATDRKFDDNDGVELN